MPAQRESIGSDHRDSGSDLKRIRERETELKRARGEISCAECRRLKLKCDKKTPCSSCTRRGCQSICPNGVLSGGQGTRFVLADTDKLHRKLAEMSKRIRQLEDALQVEYGSRSNGPHPLLADELMAIKKGLDQKEDSQHTAVADPNDPDAREDLGDETLAGAMGLLTISEGGASRYLGATGSEQALLQEAGFFDAQIPEFDVDAIASASMPIQLVQTSHMWPFTPLYAPREELQELIEAQLPSWERASSLCEAYLENLSWFFRPVDREQIVEELLPVVYKRLKPQMSSSSSPMGSSVDSESEHQTTDLHDLALLLMVFACGAAGDLTLPPYNMEAERYRQLARATLGLKSIFDGASLSAVQAVCMLGVFDVISGRKNNLETAWKMLCLGFSLSASIGLHRDPARWKLNPKIVERRRRVFWDIYMVDHWKSLSSGRPTTFALEAIDCEFPADRDATMAEDGTTIPSVWRWKCHFSREILAVVTARLCAAQPLKYSEILDLDRKVREFDIHPYLRESSASKLGNEGPQVIMQRHAITMFKEIVLLYIHRNFFARALLDHPANPLRSSFAPSFLAAYRSATTLLKTLRENYDALSHIFIRLWPIWAHALASSVIVGSVVSRGPSTSLAPSAFIELELAIALFERASTHPVVKQGLPILLRIRDKAQRALYQERTKGNTGTSKTPFLPGPSSGEGDHEDELNILRGTTRYVLKRSMPGLDCYDGPTSVSSGSNMSSPSSQPLSGEAATSSSSGVGPSPDFRTDTYGTDIPSSAHTVVDELVVTEQQRMPFNGDGSEMQWDFSFGGAENTEPAMASSAPVFSLPGLGNVQAEMSPFYNETTAPAAAYQSIQPNILPVQPGSSANLAASSNVGGTLGPEQEMSFSDLASMITSGSGQSDADLQKLLSEMDTYAPGKDTEMKLPEFDSAEFWNMSPEAWQSYIGSNDLNSVATQGWQNTGFQ